MFADSDDVSELVEGDCSCIADLLGQRCNGKWVW